LLRRALGDRNKIIRELAAVDSMQRARPLLACLEDRYTPLEFADALSRSGSLLPGPRFLLRRSPTAKTLRGNVPETYRSFEVSPDITLYRDPAFPREGKRLVFVFTGLKARPMIPVAAFLQYLPAPQFDVVMLGDPAVLSFEGGIANYAANLPDLVARLSRDFEAARYAGSATIGISVAGLTALRAGILLGADRAIAFGPRFNWHIGRLVRRGRAVPAFDLLCACGPRGQTKLLAVYSEGDADDAAHAARLGRMLPVDLRPIAGSDNHNVIHFLARAGRLQDFLLQVLAE
jgi:hypothetical protein